jgi:hypothetical protein
MARFTPEQIIEITRAHGTAEYAMDLEATMATVGPNPYWEYHPMGLALVDHEAVKVQYQILFDRVLPYIVDQTERSRAYGDNYSMIETKVRLNLDGQQSDSYFTVVVSVDDGYVVGERVYNSGPLATLLDRCFDESFRALPGVIDLFAGS